MRRGGRGRSAQRVADAKETLRGRKRRLRRRAEQKEGRRHPERYTRLGGDSRSGGAPQVLHTSGAPRRSLVMRRGPQDAVKFYSQRGRREAEKLKMMQIGPRKQLWGGLGVKWDF